MGYQNGKELLPDELLAAIQEYIDGEYIYIPRRECSRRPWGASGDHKRQTLERNREILMKYRSGMPVNKLAEEYFLAEKTVYGILARMRAG